MNNELMKQIMQLSRSKGFNPIVGDIRDKQQQWLTWYRSNVNGFHTYQRKVNGIYKDAQRMSLEMPKKICEDYHSLIWNERCEIKIEDDNARERVYSVLEENCFDINFGQQYELSMGIGMGYMIEYLNNSETIIEYINFENALPLEFTNSRIKSLLTFNYFKQEDKFITHLVWQYFEGEYYVVKHEVYESEKSSVLGKLNNRHLEMIQGTKQYKEVAKFKTKNPFFQYMGPNQKNHYDINSPYMISVYATLLDYFKVADTLFDAIQSDTSNKKTRIMIDGSLLKTKEIDDEVTGEVQKINYFDEQDTAFIALPFENNLEEPIKIYEGVYNHEQLCQALDKVVRYIGFRAGLGRNNYSFEDGNVYQNESNVISTMSDTYKSKKKHEQVLKNTIKGLVLAILELEKIAGRYSGEIDSKMIEIVFDDSIVIDDEAIEQKWIELADKNWIPIYKAIAKRLRITEDEAKEMYEEAQAESKERNQTFLQGYEVKDDE